MALVHGDDFVIAGPRGHLHHFRAKMQEWCEVNVRAIMGTGEGDDRAIVILGRQVRWCENRVEVEAGERFSKAIRREMGTMEGSNCLSAPAVRQEGVESEERVELERREASQYRGTGALANYVGFDRPDAQFAIKEASRRMAKQTDNEIAKLTRLARYLLQVPRAVLNSDGKKGHGGRGSMCTLMLIWLCVGQSGAAQAKG